MIARVLQRPTLVLNRNWQPVNVATVARALVLLWNESARVVDPARLSALHLGRLVELQPARGRAVHPGGPVPAAGAGGDHADSITTGCRWPRSPSAAATFSSGTTSTCQYCGRQPGGEELTIDHVVPRSQGGVSTLGELRAGLRGLQQAQGRPDAGAGPHAAPQAPVRPAWKPLYADHSMRIASWSKFVSEAYWNVTLEE